MNEKVLPAEKQPSLNIHLGILVRLYDKVPFPKYFQGGKLKAVKYD